MSRKKADLPDRGPTAEEYITARARSGPIKIDERVIIPAQVIDDRSLPEERGYVLSFDSSSSMYVVKVDTEYLEMGEYVYDDGLREVHESQVRRERLDG
jgi:hypothetical protein